MRSMMIALLALISVAPGFAMTPNSRVILNLPDHFEFKISEKQKMDLDCEDVETGYKKYIESSCNPDDELGECGIKFEFLRNSAVKYSQVGKENKQFQEEFTIKTLNLIPLTGYKTKKDFKTLYASQYSLDSNDLSFEIENQSDPQFKTIIEKLNQGKATKLKQNKYGQKTILIENKLLYCSILAGQSKLIARGKVKVDSEPSINVNDHYQMINQAVTDVESIKKYSKSDLEKYFALGLKMAEAISKTDLANESQDERIRIALSLENLMLSHEGGKFETKYKNPDLFKNAMNSMSDVIEDGKIEFKY
jgi:hypothetical protein